VSLSSATGPSAMAYMLENLDLRPGHHVLEIGTGTGYNAALKMGEVKNGHLILRTKHHGEPHVKILALAELEAPSEAEHGRL